MKKDALILFFLTEHHWPWACSVLQCFLLFESSTKSWYDRERFLKLFSSKTSWHKKISKPWLHKLLQSPVVCSENKAKETCWMFGSWEPWALFPYSRSATTCLDSPVWANHISEEAHPELIFLVHTRPVCWDWRSAHFSDFWYGFLLAESWTETAYTGQQRVHRMDFSLQSYSEENKTDWQWILSIDLEMVEKSWIW